MTIFNLEEIQQFDTLRNITKICQENNHIQQVAYSTYENALTQICFTCRKVRTTLNENKKNDK